jgi:hypothetical protein
LLIAALGKPLDDVGFAAQQTHQAHYSLP